MKKKLFLAFFLIFTACQPSPQIVQTAIAQTQAAYTPTPELTATATPIENSNWRVPMMQGMTEFTYDHAISTDNKLIDNTITWFQVERPVRWESYIIENIDKPTNIAKYYESVLSRRGYQVEVSYFDEKKKVGWAIFTNQDKKIYMEYFVEKLPPLILVIYKNVES